jgi:nucleotide-binding universal stress UspA family protein
MTKRIAYVPLVTYPDAVPDGTVSAVAAFAAALRCDIEATAFAAEIPKVRSPLGSMLLNVPDMIRTAEAASLARCEELQSLMLKIGASGGAEFAIRRADPDTAGAVAAVEARYADLALVPWWRDSAIGADLAQTVVFGAGRPTILVPHLEGGAAPTGRLAIAWDGSRVAARALGDALALLSASVPVTVLTVHDEKPLAEADMAERLVAALHRRKVEATAQRVMLEGRTIAEALQDAALAAGAGLLAMGGFGHSRLRDFIVGGATKGVFTDLRLPVLLSH